MRADFFAIVDADSTAIEQSVRGVLADVPAGSVGGPGESWETPFVEAGFGMVGIPEQIGGVGGSLADAATVMRSLGAIPVSLPATETAYVAGALLAHTGGLVASGDVPVLAGPSWSTMPVLNTDTRRLSGVVRHVPWARHAERLLVPAADGEQWRLAIIDPLRVAIVPGENLAGEPRDDVVFDDVQVEFSDRRERGELIEIAAIAALLRAEAVAGALATIRDLTLDYAQTRTQFGRPLAGMQIIQQHLAEIAEEVSSVHAAVGKAARDGNVVACAAAKLRSLVAGETVARLAHQVHGAMGTSQEYPLGQLTKRVWSWARDGGTREDWATIIGGLVAADPASRTDLWTTVVAVGGPIGRTA